MAHHGHLQVIISFVWKKKKKKTHRNTTLLTQLVLNMQQKSKKVGKKGRLDNNGYMTRKEDTGPQ